MGKRGPKPGRTARRLGVDDELRQARFVQLKRDGYTLQQIADMHGGITRERVRQIIAKYRMYAGEPVGCKYISERAMQNRIGAPFGAVARLREEGKITPVKFKGRKSTAMYYPHQQEEIATILNNEYTDLGKCKFCGQQITVPETGKAIYYRRGRKRCDRLDCIRKRWRDAIQGENHSSRMVEDIKPIMQGIVAKNWITLSEACEITGKSRVSMIYYARHGLFPRLPIPHKNPGAKRVLHMYPKEHALKLREILDEEEKH